MIVNELEHSAHYKLAKVLRTLSESHGIHLDFTQSDFDQLMGVYEECQSARSRIVESAAHNTYHSNDKYLEASLIQEAIHIFLSEVAPKRLNRRLRTTAYGANNE